MLDRLTGKPIHAILHFLACLAIAVGLPWSKIPLSIGTMLLLLNVLLEGKYADYWSSIKQTPLLGFLWLFIACEWISLCWTSDWDYAMHDFRVKLPLVVIPLIMSIQTIKAKNKDYLTWGFILSLSLTSFLNVGSYFHWWGNRIYSDVRELSLFESHIRYALLVVMGLGIALNWLLFEKKNQIVAFILILWLSWYTFISQVVSGYIAFVFIVMVVIYFVLLRIHSVKQRRITVAIIFTAIGLFSIFTIRLLIPVSPKVDITHLPKFSPSGNLYQHDKKHLIWENGYPVQAYIDQAVMQKEWNKTSTIDYVIGVDAEGNPIYWTLWRYMTSKGLRKDAVGFQKLSKQDIQNVENGITSIEALKSPFHARMYGIREQLIYQSNPNGHSLLQRFVYWESAFEIIQSNFFFGVGAGDVKSAYVNQYQSKGTLLEEKYQLRAHNQYITNWVSSGVFGCVAFLLWWLMALKVGFKTRSFLACCFVLISMSSFLMEDTIETQVGVTFVAFFFGLYFLQRIEK